MENFNFYDKLFKNEKISKKFLKEILLTEKFDKELLSLANLKRKEVFSNRVYLRGLIEFTNYCKNDCFYCGIRKSNSKIQRYRLTEEEILNCCERANRLGIKTFVLQGGEDVFFEDEMLCRIIRKIKEKFKKCIVALSCGEKEEKSYEAFFKAGALRYLLREETACNLHYKKLHPKEMSLKNRKNCLFTLKRIGFQVGAGFLVGSPFQRVDEIIKDIKFLEKLQPKMIGIGPFIAQKDTPFKNKKNGDVQLTIKLIAILRVIFQNSLIPVTTSILSLDKNCLEMALKAGANVLMLNITPKKFQNFYKLYDNKFKRKEKTIKHLKKLVYITNHKIDFKKLE